MMSYILSIAFETNGKGYHGFIAELPGAFVRGKTMEEATLKAIQEATAYHRWSGYKLPHSSLHIKVTDVKQSTLTIEDADSSILLNEDQLPMDRITFDRTLNLMYLSAQSITDIYKSCEYKDWVDEARIRPTFYGTTPCTIQEIIDHVYKVQAYYMAMLHIEITLPTDVIASRKLCMEQIEVLYNKQDNAVIYSNDNEQWTLKKVMRRFLWHDRIHAKSMIRILEKQKCFGMIDTYYDPFFFFDTKE